MSTKDQFNDVVEFMLVAGQEVNTEYKEPSYGVGSFRLSLIYEELFGTNELFDSAHKDDLVGMLDGICDVLYVAYGALATFGLDVPEYDFDPQHGEKSKLLTFGGVCEYEKLLKDSYEQTVRGLSTSDRLTILGGLKNLIYRIKLLASDCNFNIVGAFNEVHASNMSKFCTSEGEAKTSIEQRIKEFTDAGYVDKLLDYKDAYVQPVEYNGTTYYVIRRGSDGKVLKGTGFFEPDLSKFI